jgi:ABC-type multidrug transport system fused ATPase/permease subunit
MLDTVYEFSSNYQQYFVLVGMISAAVFVVSLLLTPFLVGLIPEDYFIDQSRHKLRINHPVHLVFVIFRTIIGFILFIAGVIMLITPGQGVVSILMGLFLMEFPGKNTLELKFINHDQTFKTLNWLRNKAGKPPLKR